MRRIKIIIAEVVVLLLVVAIGAFAYVKSLWGRMATLDWDPDNVANPYLTVEQQEQMKGYWTIACFGVDSRDMSLGKGHQRGCQYHLQHQPGHRRDPAGFRVPRYIPEYQRQKLL